MAQSDQTVQSFYDHYNQQVNSSVHAMPLKPRKSSQLPVKTHMGSSEQQEGSDRSVEFFYERGQFKHHTVKEFLDQFMPNRGGQVFASVQDVMKNVIEPINAIHFGEGATNGIKYFLHYTEKYAQLKCSCKPNGG